MTTVPFNWHWQLTEPEFRWWRSQAWQRLRCFGECHRTCSQSTWGCPVPQNIGVSCVFFSHRGVFTESRHFLCVVAKRVDRVRSELIPLEASSSMMHGSTRQSPGAIPPACQHFLPPPTHVTTHSLAYPSAYPPAHIFSHLSNLFHRPSLKQLMIGHAARIKIRTTARSVDRQTVRRKS